MNYKKFRNYLIGFVGVLAFIGCSNKTNLEQKIEPLKDTLVTQDERIQKELDDFFILADSFQNYTKFNSVESKYNNLE